MTRISLIVALIVLVAVSALPAQEPAKWDHLDLTNAKAMGDFVRITPDKTIATKKAYTGPLEITVVARTDQDNIRFWAFKGGNVIFNWEVTPGEMRIHRPDDIKKGVLGSLAASKQHPLKPDTWYTLRWKITDEWMEVAVNDKVVFAEQGTFDLSKAMPIKIGGAFGSVVDVKSFEVKPVPGSTLVFKAPAPVRQLVWTSDEARLISAGDKGIAVWDVKERKLVKKITDKSVGRGQFAVTSDGKQALVTNEDETSRWNLETGKLVSRSSRTSSKGLATFSPDGKFAALLGRTHIAVVDLDKDTTVLELPPGSPDPWNFRFAPDSKRLTLFGGGYEKSGDVFKPGKGEIKEIEIATGKEVRAYSGQEGPVFSGVYSTDGKLLATAGLETVRLWDTTTGKQLHVMSHPPLVFFTDDGKFLVSSSNARQEVIVWSTTTGKAVQGLTKRTGGIAVSRDGKIATMSGTQATVHDISSGKEVFTFNCQAGITSNMVFSPSGRLLVLGTEPGLLVVPIPNLRPDEAVAESGPKKLGFVETLNGSGADSLEFSSDGKRLLETGGIVMRVWDVASKKVLLRVEEEGRRTLTFSPDGKRIAGDDVDSLRVWDSETGKEVFRCPGRYSSIAYRPDGKWIASAEHGGRAIVFWDAATGKEVKSLKMKGSASSICFNRTGNLLAAGGFGFLTAWDVDSGKVALNVDLKDKAVQKVAFSPNGKILATGILDEPKGVVTLWDVGTGKALRNMKCSTSSVSDLAFSPDGKWLVSVGAGKTLPSLTPAQVWDTETGRLICLLDTGPSDDLRKLAISPVVTREESGKPLLGAGYEAAEQGVVVKFIVADSVAARASLKEGDNILSVSGEAVNRENFATVIAKQKVGEKVTMKVRRGEQVIDVEVVFRNRPGGRMVAISRFGGNIYLFMLPE
jgi:WD40 repeat protein